MFEAFQDQIALVEEGMKSWADRFQAKTAGRSVLAESMAYSCFTGGKRVRPLLGMLLGEELGVHPRRLLPWLCSVELIHTYSLIHDDLPCMDDDDERRGRPTNHVVYGESMALLAGDTILTESFKSLALAYADDPAKGIAAVALLADMAGFDGMAGGQAMDLESQKQLLGRDEILDMHARKTGALFRGVCEGVALLSGVPAELQSKCRQFGASLGLCFQLADDLLDSAHEIEKGSLPDLIGNEETRRLLEIETRKCLEILAAVKRQDKATGPLAEIVLWNLNRDV